MGIQKDEVAEIFTIIAPVARQKTVSTGACVSGDKKIRQYSPGLASVFQVGRIDIAGQECAFAGRGQKFEAQLIQKPCQLGIRNQSRSQFGDDGFTDDEPTGRSSFCQGGFGARCKTWIIDENIEKYGGIDRCRHPRTSSR